MPTYEYNWFGQNRYRATSSEPLPLGFSADETFNIGLDTGSPVSELYASPFKFAGAINRVEVTADAEE